MRKHSSLIDLLAFLYPEKDSSRRVVNDARMESGRIHFSDAAIENWHAILVEAKKQHKIQALIEVVGREYEAYRTELDPLVTQWSADSGAKPTVEPQPLELPLDAIPEPDWKLDIVSAKKVSQDRFFVGRDAALRTLATTFMSGRTGSVVQTVAVTGLGGIGKSALAARFMYCYGSCFPGGAFWLNLADPGGVQAEIAAVAQRVAGLNDLQDPDRKLTPDENKKLIMDAWERRPPSLIVFDGCDDKSLLAHLRPQSGRACVLVTSRRSAWDPKLEVEDQPLGELDPNDSREVLRRFRPDLSPDDPTLAAIAMELGHLPLALVLASKFLDLYPPDDPVSSPAAYLAALREQGFHHPSLGGADLADGIGPDEKNLHRTFMVSYKQLDAAKREHALALALLARAAYFAPGVPILREWLEATLRTGAQEPVTRLEVAEAFRLLVRELGLLSKTTTNDESRYRLNGLLAKFVRLESKDSLAQAVVEQLLLDEARRLGESTTVPARELQSHLRAAVDAAVKRRDERGAVLSTELGRHLEMAGDYTRARRYLKRSVAINTRVRGKKNGETARSLNYLGIVLRNQGKLDTARNCLRDALDTYEQKVNEARLDVAWNCTNLGLVFQDDAKFPDAQCCFEQALQIRTQVLEDDHADIAASLNNLGYLLFVRGDYLGARPHLERAVKIRERLPGPKTPDTAWSLTNFGWLLAACAEYSEAEVRLRQALEIREQVLGAKHPSTAQSLGLLSAVMRLQGKYTEARPLVDRAVKIYEDVLGSNHPDTAISLNHLGYLLYSQGDYGAAEGYLRQALKIREEAQNPNHPGIAVNLNDLGAVLRDQGRYDDALVYYKRAHKFCRDVLGAKHPDTATALNNLGYLLYRRGAYERGAAYLGRALKIREGQLPAHHPATATTLNDLGSVRRDQGDFEGARHCYERAVAMREKVLGPSHPDTATSLNDLGFLHYKQRDYPRARTYLERALVIREGKPGKDHPDTATTLNDLGALFREEGNYDSAHRCFERALKIRRDKLRPNHPDIATTLNNLGYLLYKQGDCDAAEEYVVKARDIRVNELGEGHPNTITSIEDLEAIRRCKESAA